MLPAHCKAHDQIVEDLKNEVQTLKMICNDHGRIIKDLESRCDMHEDTLEML